MDRQLEHAESNAELSGRMHRGVETWDSECGLGVPHWGEVTQGQTDSVGSGGGPGVVLDTLE